MSDYQVTARNFSEASENKIHSDEIAKKFGFRGALVPGVAVYGHLTHLLVKTFGERWLAHSVDSLRLRKPAYHGEQIHFAIATEGTKHVVSCYDHEGTLLADLTSAMPAQLPAPEDAAILDGQFKHPERIEIAWDNIEPMQPFAPWTVKLDHALNQTYIDQVSEPLPIYQEQRLVHPHLLLSLANRALVREYIMPAWIHVGSETRHRAALREDDEIVIRSVPLEKWRNKGHEFIRLYISFWRGDELTTDMLHTAIYQVAA